MTALSTNSIRVLDIKYGTSVDGVGLRTSIYCAGCENKCPGCHNPQSWDERGGEAMEVEELFRLIEDADMNVTFTGGDPMFHPEGFTLLAQMIKSQSHKTIWCYTGYILEKDLLKPSRAKTVHTKEMLSLIDVLVDGPFIEEEKNISLRFKGSENQRIIDVQASLKENKTILFEIEKY
jgi:anaerobic ribonucleoside-triphosphate reductase activating protein